MAIETQDPIREFSRELYRKLRQLASHCLSSERADHTLQPTALVHETYIRLAAYDRIDWEGESHVVSIASRLMRQILLNHARAKETTKRGGGLRRFPFKETMRSSSSWSVGVLELDDALKKLEALAPRLGKIVELRFFGGLGVVEVGLVLGVSPSTVERDWTLARAWLHRQLRD